MPHTINPYKHYVMEMIRLRPCRHTWLVCLSDCPHVDWQPAQMTETTIHVHVFERLKVSYVSCLRVTMTWLSPITHGLNPSSGTQRYSSLRKVRES